MLIWRLRSISISAEEFSNIKRAEAALDEIERSSSESDGLELAENLELLACALC